MLPLSEYFSSANHLVDNHVYDLEEDKEEDAELIFIKTKGRSVTKWTMMEVLEVTMIKMYFSLLFSLLIKRTHSKPKTWGNHL